MAIEWIEVDSTNIEAIGSEVGNPDLYVRFNSGSEYVYNDVPAETIQEFIDADSKGKFLNDRIKGIFDYRKIG